MRIGPVDISRHLARAATTDQEPNANRELGASGVVNLGGFLTELEYSRDLRGRKRLENLEQMRSSDGAVQEALGHITAPLLDATWDIEPASDTDDDLRVAESVRSALFRWPAQPFTEYLDQSLDYLVFGHQLFELGEQVVSDELRVERPDTDPLVEPERQWLTVRRFAQRLPHTLLRWNTDENEDLVSVTQHVFRDPGGYEEVPLPMGRCVLYVNQKRGADFTGRSLLRGAYKHWRMKELIEKIEVVALERFGVGIPVAYPSTAAAGDTAIIGKLESILENLRAGNRTYIVMPGPKGQSSAAGQDGYVLDILSPSGTPPDFDKAKQYHRGEIKGSLLVRFSELGHGQTGARSTGDTQAEVWKRSLNAVASYVGEANDPVIRWFVDANWRGVTRYPRLVARDIDSRSLQEFADAHYKLLSGGGIRPDRGYYRSVREATGMPPEDDPDALDEIEQAGRDALLQADEDGPEHTDPDESKGEPK